MLLSKYSDLRPMLVAEVYRGLTIYQEAEPRAGHWRKFFRWNFPTGVDGAEETLEGARQEIDEFSAGVLGQARTIRQQLREHDDVNPLFASHPAFALYSAIEFWKYVFTELESPERRELDWIKERQGERIVRRFGEALADEYDELDYDLFWSID